MSVDSPFRLVQPTTEDAERIRDLEDTVWFEVQPGLSAEDYVESLDPARTRVVELVDPPLLGRDPGAPQPLVGMYSDFPLHVTVPAPGHDLTRIPMAGLTWVAVHPDHRRRGMLRQMMTDHLTRVHETGDAAVAGLQAAEVGIYGRFGYGTASLDVRVTLSRGTELHAPTDVGAAADEVQTHMVTLDVGAASEALHEAHLACARTTLGSVTRSAEMARAWFRDFPETRRDKEPRRVMFAQRATSGSGSETVGYAVFRRAARWSDAGIPEGTVVVTEMGAVDAAAHLALARRLLDLDLTTKVTFHGRSVDDPLLWWAGGPRTAEVIVGDSLWVRLVDLPRALTSRGYAGSCDLVLDVVDDVCPWNAGRWRLVVDADGAATCEPTQADADLRLPVQALGAAYLGGRSIGAQAATGAVVESTPGAVVTLSRAMRTEREPVGAIGF